MERGEGKDCWCVQVCEFLLRAVYMVFLQIAATSTRHAPYRRRDSPSGCQRRRACLGLRFLCHRHSGRLQAATRMQTTPGTLQLGLGVLARQLEPVDDRQLSRWARWVGARCSFRCNRRSCQPRPVQAMRTKPSLCFACLCGDVLLPVGVHLKDPLPDPLRQRVCDAGPRRCCSGYHCWIRHGFVTLGE